MGLDRRRESVGSAGDAVIGVGAVYFPGTDYDIANALDDYEEGVWTPSLLGTSVNPTYTLSTNRSQYVKVGQLVSATVDIQVTGLTGGSGQVYMTLPFTATDVTPKPYAEIFYYHEVLIFVDLFSSVSTNDLHG